MNMGGNRDGRNSSKAILEREIAFPLQYIVFGLGYQIIQAKNVIIGSITSKIRKGRLRNIMPVSAVFKQLIIPTIIVLRNEGVTFVVQSGPLVILCIIVIILTPGPNSKST